MIKLIIKFLFVLINKLKKQLMEDLVDIKNVYDEIFSLNNYDVYNYDDYNKLSLLIYKYKNNSLEDFLKRHPSFKMKDLIYNISLSIYDKYDKIYFDYFMNFDLNNFNPLYDIDLLYKRKTLYEIIDKCNNPYPEYFILIYYIVLKDFLIIKILL